MYWFCSDYCRDEFVAEPARFLDGADTPATITARRRSR
jgi:YHS domain-containing protein